MQRVDLYFSIDGAPASGYGGRSTVSLNSLTRVEKNLPDLRGLIVPAAVGVLFVAAGIKTLQAPSKSAAPWPSAQDVAALHFERAAKTEKPEASTAAADPYEIRGEAEESQDTSAALGQLSGPELRAEVFGFVQEMLNWDARMGAIQRKAADERTAELQAIPDQDSSRKDAAWRTGDAREAEFYVSYKEEFTKNFMTTAVAYQDEMLRRLRPPIPVPNSRPLALEGSVTPQSVLDSVTYLQALARKLPEK